MLQTKDRLYFKEQYQGLYDFLPFSIWPNNYYIGELSELFIIIRTVISLCFYLKWNYKKISPNNFVLSVITEWTIFSFGKKFISKED